MGINDLPILNTRTSPEVTTTIRLQSAIIGSLSLTLDPSKGTTHGLQVTAAHISYK
jgi:hypothetical protein